MKKTCNNCIHLKYEDGGFKCKERDYQFLMDKLIHEKHLQKKNYRDSSKACCELKENNEKLKYI